MENNEFEQIPIEDETKKEECSICFRTFRIPITTNCGHKFCAKCFTSWWENNKTNNNFCPICVQTVEKIVPLPYDVGNLRKRDSMILKKIERYNKSKKKTQRKENGRCSRCFKTFMAVLVVFLLAQYFIEGGKMVVPGHY